MNFKLYPIHALLTASLFLAFMMASGCSNDKNISDMPLFPNGIADDQQFGNDYSLPGINEDNSHRQIVGQWTVDFNLMSHTATIGTDREVSVRYNITSSFPTPAILVKGFDATTGIVDVDVTVRNVFPVDGYDLRLIVFNNAGHQLKNADDWTSAYDLSGGLPINPFKAYAKNEPERIFAASSQYTENLKIFLPSGNTNVKIAIDVAYPTHSPEPYEVDKFYQDPLLQDPGSSANLWVSVFDWQDDVDSVSLYCPEITGQPVIAFSKVDANLYQTILANNTGAPAGDYIGVIVASSGGVSLYDIVSINVYTAKNTIGLLKNIPGSFAGYTLFSPIMNTTTYLVDMDGNLVHTWFSDDIGNHSVYLLENGNLLHTDPGVFGVNQGGCEDLDWDSNIVWDFDFPIGPYFPHHDAKRLPNGNTLFVVREPKSKLDAVIAGRSPETLTETELWPEAIIEVKPTGPTSGEIVWEWHAWNHMCSDNGGVADGRPVSTDASDPGKLNLNYYRTTSADWLHFNTVDYNPEFDQVLISCREFSEIYIIDHSTANYADPQAGIEAAKEPAGDILYRWGNPIAYRTSSLLGQQFLWQHDAQWITPGLPGEGNILVFNNGGDRLFSSVDELIPPVDANGNYEKLPGLPYGPDSPAWSYTSEIPFDFYSELISGNQRLPNGNTLICSGIQGWLFEVTPDMEVVWEYINPVNYSGPQRQGRTITGNYVFRSYRYAAGYLGLAGRDLTPQGPLELPRD